MDGMTRRETWYCLLAGSGLYQGIKYSLGFAVTPETLFAAACWSGVALLVHWGANRGKRRKREAG
jgi:hypothetical protein